MRGLRSEAEAETSSSSVSLARDHGEVQLRRWVAMAWRAGELRCVCGARGFACVDASKFGCAASGGATAGVCAQGGLPGDGLMLALVVSAAGIGQALVLVFERGRARGTAPGAIWAWHCVCA